MYTARFEVYRPITIYIFYDNFMPKPKIPLILYAFRVSNKCLIFYGKYLMANITLQNTVVLISRTDKLYQCQVMKLKTSKMWKLQAFYGSL